MLLVCDIGNSYIKTAVFDRKKLIKFKADTSLSAILKRIKVENVNEVAVTSVVPKKLTRFKSALNKQRVNLFEVNREVNFNLKIDYETPQTLGMDRLCSAEGAYYLLHTKYKSKNFVKGDYLISVDCGTATTVNVIKHPNNFLGGLIAPGMQMMFNSLNANTAQLPKVEITDYYSFIGKSTKSAIASGVINSITGLLNQVIHSLHPEPKLIFITGGNAKHISPHLKFNYIDEKMLVLYGIKSIYDKNKVTN